MQRNSQNAANKSQTVKKWFSGIYTIHSIYIYTYICIYIPIWIHIQTYIYITYIYIYCIIYHIHLDPMTPSVFAVPHSRWTSGRCVAGSAESQALQLGWQWSCWVPSSYNAHMLHVWYIYLQNWVIYGAYGMVNIPYMEHMGWFISIDIVNIIINSPKGVALLKVSAKTCRPKRCSSPSWSQLNNM